MARSSTNSAPQHSNSYTAHLRGCTIRSRVAFVLAIAEVARTAIETGEIVAKQMRYALDLAWRWEQFGDVSGVTLSEAAEGESGNQDNLANWSSVAPDVQKPAWVVVVNAIMYASWHAHLAAGDKKGMSETVCEYDDGVIDEVTDYAGRIPGFDLRLVDRLAQHCLDHHRAADASVLGEPIPREVMLQIATATG